MMPLSVNRISGLSLWVPSHRLFCFFHWCSDFYSFIQPNLGGCITRLYHTFSDDPDL